MNDLLAHAKAFAAKNVEARRCSIGGEPVFLLPGDPDKSVPGQIYTEAGAREYAISGACEHHFDRMFAEDE